MKKLMPFVIIGCLVLWAGAAMANVEDVHAKTTTTYTVQAGDSLFSIAQHFDPQDDPRSVVGWITEKNHCGDVIQPGQKLVIPVGRN